MKKLLIFALLFGSQLMVAQTKIYQSEEVDVKPQFPGGAAAYMKFVESNFNRVPEKYSRQMFSLDFIVQANGKLANVKGKNVACHMTQTMLNPYFQDNDQDITIGPAENGLEREAVIDDENQVYNTAGIEVRPEFPGGMDKFYQFFNANFKKPDEENLKGKIFACFIVEKDGSLSDIRILRDIGYDTGKETIRVIRLSPKWNPGQQNGKTVRVQYCMPFPVGENQSQSQPEKK